jgi:hypothetical protein
MISRCMIGAWFVLNVHPKELVGDVGQVESRFGPFGDSVNLSAR